MDIQDIITNGMLESYALDELSEVDAEKINLLLAENLVLGEALERIYILLEAGSSD